MSNQEVEANPGLDGQRWNLHWQSPKAMITQLQSLWVSLSVCDARKKKQQLLETKPLEAETTRKTLPSPFLIPFNISCLNDWKLENMKSWICQLWEDLDAENLLYYQSESWKALIRSYGKNRRSVPLLSLEKLRKKIMLSDLKSQNHLEEVKATKSSGSSNNGDDWVCVCC